VRKRGGSRGQVSHRPQKRLKQYVEIESHGD
jgi:hypothetical protein